MLRYEMFYEDSLCQCSSDGTGYNGEVCDVNKLCVYTYHEEQSGLFVQTE